MWQHRDRMSAAWHGAAISRAKKIPAIDKILGDTKRLKPQTPEQMLALMQSLVKST